MSQQREGQVPYQFYLPTDLHKQARDKLEPTGLDLAKFMRMAVEQLVDQPLAKSVALLDNHNSKQRRRRK